ncbi:MAG: septal ring lytic transglycosylase RlpA family protein [Rhodocyclaceae bacterium]
MPHLRRKLRPATALTLLLFLAACAGRPAPHAERSEAPAETAKAPQKTAKRPNLALKRGGGYYKDDGPADDIPDNLDEIPDAEPKAEPLHRFANKPYVVLGKSYVPNTSLQPYKTRGIASWYGKKFHGQKTSIGERYDMFSMTAAHPTLAIPSYVRVSSPDSGKSVIVRVTDRGPFHADRVIDLSYVAAHKLGFINNGSGPVEVESILSGDMTSLTYAQVAPPEKSAAAAVTAAVTTDKPRDEMDLLAQNLALDTTLPAAASAARPALQRGIFLQLGAFASADNAESLRSHLTRELDWLSEGVQINTGGGMHRVHLGPYANRGEAEKVAERIRLALGYKPTFVTR